MRCVRSELGCAQSSAVLGKERQERALQGWKLAVSVSAVVAWRKPHQGSDPDVLGCLQAQDAGGFSVGMARNKWIRKNEQNRKQEGKNALNLV